MGGQGWHTLKFYVKVFFLLWEKHCQVSCPVRGQYLFIRTRDSEREPLLKREHLLEEVR